MALASRRRQTEEPTTDRPAADQGEPAARPATRPAGGARVAAAGAAAGVGALLLVAARVIRVLAGLAAAILVAAILLRVLGANPTNTIVKDVHDVGNTLAGPFKNVFTVKNPKTAIAVNWGLAAVVYLVVGTFLASLLTRFALRARAPRARTAAA